MQPLANKKAAGYDVFIKLGSDQDKKKELAEKEEKAKKSMSIINAFLKPVVVGEFHYLPLQKKVGTMFDGALSVYASAQQIDNGPDLVFFAFVLTTDLRSHNRLRIEYAKSSLVGETHPNILPVVAFEYLSSYACLAIQKVDDSLRSFIAARSENGIRFDFLIPVVLKEVLKGLCFIHDQGLRHGNLDLGYVYLTGKYENAEIKLGFAASTFEMESTGGPAARCLPKEWTDEKSDIWMLGLMGLELAYGGLSFTEEKHLDALSKKINKTKRLPSRATMRDYQIRGGGLSFFSKIRSRFDYRADVDDRVCDLLASCFEQDPRNRPTAQELLQHKAFEMTGATVGEFWLLLEAEGIAERWRRLWSSSPCLNAHS